MTSEIQPGNVWAYEGDGSVSPYGKWSSVSGSFSLSTDSDQIFVYVGSASDPTFLFGLSTSPWVEQGTPIDTTNSVCPAALIDNGINASIFFNYPENGMYAGPRIGTKNELLDKICNSTYWLTSDTEYYDYRNLSQFYVIDPASVTLEPTMSSGGSSRNSNIEIFGLSESNSVVIISCVVVLFIILVGLFSTWKYFYVKKDPLASREDRRSSVEFSGSGHIASDIIAGCNSADMKKSSI